MVVASLDGTELIPVAPATDGDGIEEEEEEDGGNSAIAEACGDDCNGGGTGIVEGEYEREGVDVVALTLARECEEDLPNADPSSDSGFNDADSILYSGRLF